MLVDFVVKGGTEDDKVLGVWRGTYGGVVLVKPQVQAIEEVKPRPIEEKLAIRLIVRSKEDRGRENALEAFHDAVVSLSVFQESEEVEHFSRSAETDDSAGLAQGQGGHPNGNETVLAEGKPELRMAADLEEEFAVLSGVGELVLRRPAEWKPTKDKGPRMEG